MSFLVLIGFLSNNMPRSRTPRYLKPIPISYEMCDFLGVPRDTLMTRSEVTTNMYYYAEYYKLINKNTIQQDDALAKLLRLRPGTHVNLEHLQWYLLPHYSPPSFHQIRTESQRRTHERTNILRKELLQVFCERCSPYFVKETFEMFGEAVDELEQYLADHGQVD